MRIGFIGVGNMGYALLTAAMKGEGNEVLVYDKDTKKAEAAAERTGAAVADVKTVARECELVLLGVKPDIIPHVIAEIKSDIGKDTVLVSMAAGVKIGSIEGMLGTDGIGVIRIMPNLAAAIGEGMVLWCANAAADGRTEAFIRAMGAAGIFTRIDEVRMDAGSAVSGCGPAFAYMFIEALADGGVECGLGRDEAIAYAAQVLIGAARMVQQTGKPPKQLRDEVCSPGGSTIEGVRVLENGDFGATVSDAVKASYEKTGKLGK